jgi:hypothetical protein
MASVYYKAAEPNDYLSLETVSEWRNERKREEGGEKNMERKVKKGRI